MKECSFDDIQTPIDVWQKILELNPIDNDAIFYEPFKGTGNLYNQITNKKYWSEITENKDVFDFENKNEITCIYSNFPFKCMIPNKKGEMKYKNAGYYFLEYFIDNYPNLKTLGSLMSSKLFNALTPKRLKKLADKGFTIKSITCFNCTYWYNIYYFVLFEKNTNNDFIKVIEKTFTQK
jgi:hypothetical protein